MIQLQFSTQRAFSSACIRWFTDSPVSHVDVVMPDGSLLGSLSDGGVQIRPSEYANWSKVIVAEVDADFDAIWTFLKAQIGKPYDRTAIVSFALSRNWREDDSWFCSELVAAAFESAGLPLKNPNWPFAKVTPADLLKSPLVKYNQGDL